MSATPTTAPLSAPLPYEALVAEFQDGLLNALRGHGAAQEFLEMWVPDEDPVLGILNMVESAEAAGCPAIAVRVRLDTLPAARHAELEGLLAGLGIATVRTEEGGGTALVTVAALGAGAALQHLHPALRAGVGRRLAAIAHEGTLPETAGLLRIAATDGPAELAVLVDPATHLVEKARHDQGRGPVERALLDALCAVVEGTPVDDAADHGPIRALAALLDADAPRPVPGILHPVNADPAFGPVLRLAHRLRDAYRARGTLAERHNEFDLPPSAGWTLLGADARAARVTEGIAAFLDAAGRPADAMALLRIDDDLHGHPVRVVATFGAGVAAGDKPDLMRALERHLKRTVEGTVQLYHEQRRDENSIRRL